MISVAIVGSGNVATHLITAFLKADNIVVTQVVVRNLKKKQHLNNKVCLIDNISHLKKTDVTILAISDDVIKQVSSTIKDRFVVHTSGSVPLNALQNTGSKGVFYMLQSFSKNKKVNFLNIPFCLEADNDTHLNILESLAKSIGEKIYHINSEQRKHLHVAAVFANNFVNHMYCTAYEICKEYSVPFKVLQPLIKETALKIEHLTPLEAQTGPAIRNDKKTIKNHLSLLNNHQQKIYTLLTKSIKNARKEL